MQESWGSVPGVPPGGGNDNPLQYSCLENPMDRGLQSMGLQRVRHDLAIELVPHLKCPSCFSSFSPPFKTHFILQGSVTGFSSCFSLWASLPMLTHSMQLPYSFGPCLPCLRPYLELLFYPSHHFLTCCLLLPTRLWLPEGQRWNVSSFLCIFHNLTLQCNRHSVSTCQILCSSLGKLSQLNNQDVLA